MEVEPEDDDITVSSRISWLLSQILKQLNKKVLDSLIKIRFENGVSSKYIPWHIVNRIMNLHAPGFNTYTPDGEYVSVIYRVTPYGTDAEKKNPNGMRKTLIWKTKIIFVLRKQTGLSFMSKLTFASYGGKMVDDSK
ncbi:hypothetical protein UlMin_041554 [Ulmus minor]